MNIDVSKIVADKLTQLDAEGTIKRKIEDTIEKSVLDAVTSELGSYAFRNSIASQLKESVSEIAADCGLSAYNGFIAQTIKNIVQESMCEDISTKVQNALNDVMLQKHENIRLSDIFERYRTWIRESTDEADKYERQNFTGELEIQEDGHFTRYICRFADHVLDKTYLGSRGCAEIEIRFLVYGDKRKDRMSLLYLDGGKNLGETLRIGALNEFEAFVANLYYNKTEIILDVEDVNDDDSFDIEY